MTETRPLITVFTPAYNRAHTLPLLRDSLLRQSVQSFEWLVIDDGSTDDTARLLDHWSRRQSPFTFRYVTVPNGGKPRAINRACALASGEYLFIVDSDDRVVEDGIERLTIWIEQSLEDPTCVGVGGVRQSLDPQWNRAHFGGRVNDYVLCNNLARRSQGILGEMNEAYRVDVLSQYPFRVWPGETFAPEQIVFDQMALDGWVLRWFDEVLCVGDYETDGLTANADVLEARNPMGYSMLANHKLKYVGGTLAIRSAVQHIALAIVGGGSRYILESNRPWLTLVVLPVGLVQSLRRRRQFRKRLVDRGAI